MIEDSIERIWLWKEEKRDLSRITWKCRELYGKKNMMKREEKLSKKVIIETENGAKTMGKPVGTYITLGASPNLIVPDEDYHFDISKLRYDKIVIMANGKYQCGRGAIFLHYY